MAKKKPLKRKAAKKSKKPVKKKAKQTSQKTSQKKVKKSALGKKKTAKKSSLKKKTTKKKTAGSKKAVKSGKNTSPKKKSLGKKKTSGRRAAPQTTKQLSIGKRVANALIPKEEEPFLIDIMEDYGNDAPRLVFADWLEEQGQLDRAEFIRVQIRADQLQYVSPYAFQEKRLKDKAVKAELRELKKREKVLLKSFFPDPELLPYVGHRRGILESAWVEQETDEAFPQVLLSKLPGLITLQRISMLHEAFYDSDFTANFFRNVLNSLPYLRSFSISEAGEVTAEHVGELAFLPRLVMLNAEFTDNGRAIRDFYRRKEDWYLSLPPEQQRRETLIALPLLSVGNLLVDRETFGPEGNIGQSFFEGGNTMLFRAAPEFESLFFSDSWILSSDLHHLATLPKLKKLEMNRTSVGDLSPLRHAPALEELSLYRMFEPVPLQSAVELARNPSLKTVYVENLTEAAITKMNEVNPKLDVRNE